MKVVVNLSGIVMDSDKLDILEQLLGSCERQDYDY